jgi:hypothetical protein
MKDVIFEDENDDFQPRTVLQKIRESALVGWLIKKKLVETQYEGTVFLLILSIILFAIGIAIFLQIPPVWVPPVSKDATQSGLISLPNSVK